MPDAIGDLLRLVAAGRLTPEEAAPLLDELEGADRSPDRPGPAGGGPGSGPSRPRARYARVVVSEAGKRVVDLRVPLALGRLAMSRIPGFSAVNASEVQEAFEEGLLGPIVDIEDEAGDGVRITLE